MALADLTTTVSTKGQVILPKVIRDQLRWSAGTRLMVEYTTDGVLLKPLATPFAPTRPEDVFGCLTYTGVLKSVDDMNARITPKVKHRHAHSRY